MKILRPLFLLTMISLFLSCQSPQLKTNNFNMPPNAYLGDGPSTVGVILCHGRAQNPTWRVVNPLRKGIHKQLGYHTLSLQMPNSNINWKKYGKFFPDAYKRIEAAIQFLRNEKGIKTIYLMGHSMGSRMATGYLSEHPESKVSGFIGVGVQNGGGIPLDSLLNLKIALKKSSDLKVLDVYGDGGDGNDARHAQARSFLVSERYKQILIPKADHQFLSGEEQMVKEVVRWLKEQE